MVKVTPSHEAVAIDTKITCGRSSTFYSHLCRVMSHHFDIINTSWTKKGKNCGGKTYSEVLISIFFLRFRPRNATDTSSEGDRSRACVEGRIESSTTLTSLNHHVRRVRRAAPINMLHFGVGKPQAGRNIGRWGAGQGARSWRLKPEIATVAAAKKRAAK